MLTPSNVQAYEFNNAIKANGKTHIRITATLGSTTYTLTDDDVHSSGLSMPFYLNSDTDLTIGKAVTREVAFKLIRTANVQAAVLNYGFTVEIGVDIYYANGTFNKTGWVTLGKFYPIDDDNYYDADVKDVVAYDCMNKFDIPADEWLQSLTYPMTVEQMFTSLCNYVGVTGEIGNALANMKARSFSEAPIKNTGLMCRDVLELIAEACGCYARITPDEHCKLVWFTVTGWNLTNDEIFERGIKQYMSQVSGVNVRNTEDDIGVLYPTNADPDNLYVIVDNPFLVTANATEETNYIVPLYDRLRQYNHYPFTLTGIGNPLIEAGDIIYAYPSNDAENPRWFPVYVKEMLWNGACTDMYQSTGNRTRKVYSSAVKQKLSIGGRYHIFKNDIEELYSEIADAEGDITALGQRADAIELSAGKKARMWYANTAPTGTASEPLVANVDYWIDTAHDRKLMRWTGSAWAAADDISKYAKQSGITIDSNGVEVTGSKYVKIQSGGSFYVDATNFKIDSANRFMKCGSWQFDDNGVSYTLDSNTEFRIIKAASLSSYPKTKTGIRMNKVDGNYLFSIIIPDISNNVKEFVFAPYNAMNGRSAGISFDKPSDTECSIGDEYFPWDYGFFDQIGAPSAPAWVYSNRLYMTSAASGNGIVFKGTKADSNLIRFVDNTADAYGNGIVIGDGGLVVIGAGESAAAMASGKSGGDETLYLGSDGAVLLYTNVQNGIGSAKQFQFNTSGTFSAPGRIYQNGNQAVPLSDTWRGFEVKQYQYTYTIPANGDVSIRASDFGINATPGYTAVAIAYFNTSDSNVECYYLNPTATGYDTVAMLHNRANAQVSHPMAIKILFLQN